MLCTSCKYHNSTGRRPAFSYESLNNEILILGKLGLPLGTRVNVKGEWQRQAGPTKGDDYQFVVSEVNGSPVGAIIKFEQSRLSPFIEGERAQVVEGSVWEFEGFETGGYCGIPAEILQSLEEAIQIGEPYGFSTEFVYVKCRQIRLGE
jgi:hypothetical protein